MESSTRDKLAESDDDGKGAQKGTKLFPAAPPPTPAAIPACFTPDPPLSSLAPGGGDPQSDYCIIVSETTEQLWSSAVTTLCHKHAQLNPQVLRYKHNVFETMDQLRKYLPKYTVFVAQPYECSRKFVREVHHATRSLDPTTTFSDTLWGILCAATLQDAVRIAAETTPLLIKAVFAGTVEGSELEMFQSGMAYDELQHGHVMRKQPGQPASHFKYRGDETVHLAADLNRANADMIITSGHARQRIWSLGYRFQSGNFLVRHSASGPQLYAETLAMEEIPIASPNPKVLSAAGNCLMGHICDEGAIACAWMHSAGVRQMAGYTVPTWFGYGGWGLHKYFTRVSGLSFAQAFFANMQSLLLQLSKYEAAEGAAGLLEDAAGDIDAACEALYRRCFDSTESREGLSRAHLGLLFDRDHVVLYGDPAWPAAVAPPGPPPYTIDFEVTESTATTVVWHCTVHVHAAGSWTSPTPDDKTTSPGRPPFALLPTRVRAARVRDGRAVATRLFVLFDVDGPCAAGDTLSATIEGSL